MAKWCLALCMLVVACTASEEKLPQPSKTPAPPKTTPPPKVKPDNSAKLPDNIKFFTVQIDELWFKEKVNVTDNNGLNPKEKDIENRGFYAELLDLIGTEMGYDIDPQHVEKAPSFDEAIKKMNDFHGSGIFLAGMEKDGIYKDRINFTVPVFTAAYVQVYPAGMDETTRATLDVTTLNFTNAQDTIAQDPKTVKKLPANQQAGAAAGKGGKPADLKKAFKDVQEKSSVFVGRTPVLEKMVLSYPDLKIQPLGEHLISRFGFSKNSYADPQVLERLDAAIMKLHRDCSIYRLWTARFPTSAYIDPIHNNNENSGKGNENIDKGNENNGKGNENIGRGNSDDGCALAKDNNGNGPGRSGPEGRSLRMQQVVKALEKADPALVQRMARLLQARLSHNF